MRLETLYEEESTQDRFLRDREDHDEDLDSIFSTSNASTSSEELKGVSEAIMCGRVSSLGMIVQEYIGPSKKKKRYRRITFRNGQVVIYSLLSSKSIGQKDVISARTLGKRLILDTTSHGLVLLKMPLVSDALALRNILE